MQAILVILGVILVIYAISSYIALAADIDENNYHVLGRKEFLQNIVPGYYLSRKFMAYFNELDD